MASSGKIHWRDRLAGPSAVIVPSSEEASFNRDALRRLGLNDRLRWRQGWDVVTGVNDRIDFNRGGDKVATIASGNYATVNEYAVAVKNAMATGDGTDTYAASFDPDTGLWTLTNSDGHTFTVLGATGANAARSALPDLGFAAVDTSAATAVTGPAAAFMSRKWVNIDLGAVVEASVWDVGPDSDALDVQRQGVEFNAFLQHGRYLSAVAYAAAAQAALALANPAGAWLVTWDPGSGFSFAMTGGGVNARLLTGTGANLDRAAWVGYGFDVGTDSSLTNVFVSDFVPEGTPYNREDIVLIAGHNLPAGSSVRVDADSSSMLAVGLNATVAHSVALMSDQQARTDVYRADLEPALRDRYYRIVIDARLGGSAFVEVGVVFIGETIELPGIQPSLRDARQSQTSISYAVSGMHAAVQRPSRRVLELTVNRIFQADKAALEAFAEETRPGGAFFFNLDPDDDDFALRYVFMPEDIDFDKNPETGPLDQRMWSAALTLNEILG